MQLLKQTLAGASPALVISLDLELMWGVRDIADKSTYGQNVLGERQAIPAMLDLFSTHGVRATWATVGMAFAENKEELIHSSPALRPTYSNPRLSSYSYFDEVGKDEASDPYYFGASLIRQIQKSEGQEIGSHTFSHYYCLETGQTVEQFEADMDAAVSIASRHGIDLKSFVFPRNQRSPAHLAILSKRGISTFRGNESSWIHKATPGAMQPKLQRVFRLADHYINLSGQNTHNPLTESNMVDIPSSRFLRPFSRKIAFADSHRLRRITSAMTHAARQNQIFHLWWHPHNFGVNVQENIGFLASILDHYQSLSSDYGMVSRNMGDFS